jgi:hypothetical protein
LRVELDAQKALRLTVDSVLDIVERVSPVRAAIQAAAADPDVAVLLPEMNRRRFETLAVVSELLAGKRGFPRRLTSAQLADVFYGVASPDLHRLFTVDRGWSDAQWRDWVHVTLAATLSRGSS